MSAAALYATKGARWFGWAAAPERRAYCRSQSRRRHEGTALGALKNRRTAPGAPRNNSHYIVVGEVLGPEALPLLTAMSTGHPGICTVHAQSPARLFDRLALALLQAHLPVAPADLLRFLAEAVDVVAYIERMADGSRKITMISEIDGWADGAPILRPLFRFVPERVSAAQVEGDFWLEDEPTDRLRAKLARWGVTL